MFNPQKKAPWTPIPPSPAPRTDASKGTVLVAGRLSSAAKGKAVAFADGSAPPPPPLSFLDGNRGGTGYDCGNMEDWRRFKEAGLLDAVALERRDQDALVQTVSRLEKELHDYQYNMGLLLIEKKELSSNCEELSHEVAEAQEILKREQSAHYIAMFEVEKRGENLKKALDLEKNCVVDLERAVNEMRDELERAKATTKRDDVDARIAQLQDERVEVEGKLHSANIRAAEADQKIKELEMKLQELQARETTLVMQHQTLDMEREAYESKLKKQKEEFKIRERKLQEREERLHEQRRTLDGREDKLRESERRYTQKESDIDQLQKKIDLDNCTLKQREDDVGKRLNELVSIEKEAEAVRVNLEKREKQLHALEERLGDKERMEIQKLVDEHRAILETKSEEFELEMLQKRNSLDEDFKRQLHVIEKKEVEVNHQEAKLAKMEQALREKSERVKEKEKKIEERSNALRQEESCLKNHENLLEDDRKQLSSDRENVQILNGEIEKLRDELRKKEMLIQEESEKHKSNEEMRAEHIRLQSSLNQEMEKWRHQNALLMSEKEDLSQESRKVGKDWETLDEKRAIVDKELKKLEEEKESFERFRYLEEEKLKKEKIEMDSHIKQELESIRLEKESFAAKVQHEKLTIAENARDEHQQIVQEFEQQRREFESHVQKQLEEKVKELQEKMMAFEERRSREIRNINDLKELAEKQKEEMESGWLKVKKAREEIAFDKQKLDEDQREIHKDIISLGSLSKKLKGQREQLLNERAHFLSFIEKLKVCQTCGDLTSEFVVSDLQLPVADEREALPLPQSVGQVAKKSSLEAVDMDLSNSGAQKSWLRKCASKVFKVSSIKRMQDDIRQCQEESPTSAVHPSVDEKFSVLSLPVDEDKSQLRFQGSAHDRRDPPADDPPLAEDPSNIDSKEQAIPEESEQSSLQSGRRKAVKKISTGVRTRSAKTAVGDTKNNHRETSTLREGDEDGEPSYSNLANAEGDKTVGTTARKRTRAKSSRGKEGKHDDDSSDGPTDSMPGGGRKKRREAVVSLALPTPGKKGYNLRRHKAAGATTAAEASNSKGNDDRVATNHSKRSKKAIPNPQQDSAFDLDVNSENFRNEQQGPVSTSKSIELSSDKAVIRFKMPVDDADDNVEVAKPIENILAEEPYSMDNTFLSEEARESPQNAEEDDESMPVENDEDDEGDGGDDDESDGGDDDESDDPGDASIGRKVWKFFTT